MVEKIRPNATVEWRDGNYLLNQNYYIQYKCPECCKKIFEGDIACDECGTFFDWSQTAHIKIVREVEWR